MARNDPRYRAERNRAVPKRIDSHLTTFDCITCDKCLPVCPNAAVFKYPTPVVAFESRDIIVSPDGSWRHAAEKRCFAITRGMQIACYADFCNECGNCDTFCPEYGGPYIQKPTFFGSVKSWERAAPRDGFVTGRGGHGFWIRGRVHGRLFELATDPAAGRNRFDDGVVAADFSARDHSLIHVKPKQPLAGEHAIDMWTYHALRHLLAGVLDAKRANQVNAACL